HKQLRLQVLDETGAGLPARVSITDGRLRAYAPDDAWIYADDSIVPGRQAVETRYFHTPGTSVISVPVDPVAITIGRGPSYEVVHLDEDPRAAGWSGTRTVTLRRLSRPKDSGDWWSGDLHVHMNYGGLYRNTPAHLVQQGEAED